VEHLPQRALIAALIVVVAFTAQNRVFAHGSQDHDRVSVLVRVDNMANVPDDVLRLSEARAREIFSRIAVHLEWIDSQTASRDEVVAPFTVVIMSKGAVQEKAATEDLADGVLGEAARVAHRAYIFYDRIVAVRVVVPRDLGSILGDVIGHELGHLMLPPNSHSANGIMRAGLELRPGWAGTFDKRQALLIRRVIAAR
jgi:hypothetical protein